MPTALAVPGASYPCPSAELFAGVGGKEGSIPASKRLALMTPRLLAPAYMRILLTRDVAVLGVVAEDAVHWFTHQAAAEVFGAVEDRGAAVDLQAAEARGL